MSQLSKCLIVLCAIVLVVLVSVLTITLRKDRRQVVEEILTAKVPKLAGDTRLKQLSTIIAEEIGKTDEHRQDRVDDLLVAIEESESLPVELDGDELEDELSREILRNKVNWFLNTEPPTPAQRKQIQAQIDEIVVFTNDIALDLFPGFEAEVEESVNNLRHSLMWEYNDPLKPTLKRLLSEAEMEEIRAKLVKVQNQISNRVPGAPVNLEDPLSKNDVKQYLSIKSAFPRLFVTPLSAMEVYKLPLTEKMTQLGNVLSEEFIHRAQVKAERSFREDDLRVQRLFEKQRAELAAQDAQEMAQRTGVNRQDKVGSLHTDETDDSGKSFPDFNRDRSAPPIPLGEKDRNNHPSNAFDAIHRNFEIFDDAVLLPAETQFYTGKYELMGRSIFSNYRINTGIDDDVFDEQYLLAGAGISGVKGEWLRAKIALAHAQRAGKEASTYAHILPVVESVASADDAAMSIEARHLLTESLIEQKKYTEAIKSIMTLLEQVASTEGYADLRAAGRASGFATQFIKHGRIDLAQNILDKYVQYYVQYCTKKKQDLFQQALENFRSRYFHGIKLFEYIAQHTTDEAIKARCQFAIACCSDMIARESIDASTWYKTDAKKKEAVNQALRHYEAVIAKYPESRYAGWASHFSGFLATYPPKMGKPPQNTTAPPELIEQQAGKIMSDVRKILRSQRSQWGDALIDIYAKNVQAAYEGTLYRALTPAEYDHFRNSFSAYCERALPERLNNVDELAIELITIRWAVRQYVSRLDLANEQTEAAVDRQVELIIEGFDQFVATYLYDKSLESKISATKNEFREAVDLYRRNILYPIFKVPLSPRELWRYERSILFQEERIGMRLKAYTDTAERKTKTGADKFMNHQFNQLILSQKRDEIQWIIEIWLGSIGRAYNTIFPDEFHPEDPTKKRVIQYHYLPNKGIKLTFLVDKEDYPKLGLD